MKQKKTIKGLIEEARINNSIKLNLFDIEETMSEFPNELFELTNLQELHVGDAFSVSKLPNRFTELVNLKQLTIKCNASKFPTVLLEMQSLESLTFESDKIKELPKELGSWKNLVYLNMGSCAALNKVKALPPNLEYIFLNGTKLKTLPDMIFELKKLRKLVAHFFEMKEIPKEIFYLKKLGSLFLSDNLTDSVPEAILDLIDLKELWLDDNQFIEFPEVVGFITGLRGLNLSNNLLTSIPHDISRLKELETLYLGGNQLTEFPEAVTNIVGLKELKLSNYWSGKRDGNKIRIIPDSILKLKNLIKLDLFGNPIENIPQSIVRAGAEATINFLQSKVEADKEEYLYEAKMVIVGRGDVGKTVLTQKLTNPTYSLTKSPSTKGISILRNPFEFKTDNLAGTKSFRFNIWDFGGQEKYDATHQIFITNRSVYLFLTEARAESNYQDVFYWLNTLSLFSENSPVIVVLSKYDERKKLLPESTYRERFKNIVRFVDVSCADGFEYTIDNLKSSIKEAIKLLPQTNLTLSNHWVAVRSELEKLSNLADYIEYEQYLKICSDNKLNKERADFLSEYLNDLGVIIHKQNDLLLRKTVIINTDWCVDGMYKVLDDERVFQNKGKFSSTDLTKIWNDRRFDGKQAELVRLMQNYGLCFELMDRSGYIAPDLLPLDKPENLTWTHAKNLLFEYRYTFMPSGMLSRFIVKSHSFIKESLYWKHGVVLNFDNTEALIEEDYINSKIKVAINGENKKGLLSAIRMIIEEIHKDFDKDNKLSFEEMVPCNCSECLANAVPHFYKFKVLKKFEAKRVTKIHCEQSSASVVVSELINDIQIKSPIEYIETDIDLKLFIMDLLSSVLEREITFKGGYLNFWRDKQCQDPKDEPEIQPYICNTLDNYCKTNGIQLSREVREANGNVDILFSSTNKNGEILKVCLELKKAHHQDIETAVSTQLPLYMKSSGTMSGIYLVIWFKNKNYTKPQKYKTLNALEKQIKRNNTDENIDIKIISCSKFTPPSKAKKVKRN